MKFHTILMVFVISLRNSLIIFPSVVQSIFLLLHTVLHVVRVFLNASYQTRLFDVSHWATIWCAEQGFTGVHGMR